MWLSELTLQLIAFRVLALLPIAAVLGGTAAGSTVFLGDKGPKYDGRLTILPSNHIDLVGAVSLVLFGYGWAKPTVVDARQFRIGRSGIFVVILAGFIGLVITAALLDALILPALTSLPYTAGLTTAAFLRSASSLSIACALLCLIPIPPLSGGLVLSAFGIHIAKRAQWILVVALLAALATGLIDQLLSPAHAILASVILSE